MRGLIAGLTFVALLVVPAATAGGWTASVPFTNVVASTPFKGGGYAGYAPGATAPTPGSCRLGDYNANLSESWIAVQPGTENLVGTSKVFFEKFSTFYNFHLGSHTIVNGDAGRLEHRPGLRVRHDGHPGDAAELDEQHRPERRLRLPGPGVPDDASVQRLLGESAPQLEHRHRLQRRPRPELGEGQRWQAARACAQLVEPRVRLRRGQAVDRGQPLPDDEVRGSRLLGLVDLQRVLDEDQAGRLA